MLEHITTAAQRPEGATVGLDVGDRYTHLCVLDAAGEIARAAWLESTSAFDPGSDPRFVRPSARIEQEMGDP